MSSNNTRNAFSTGLLSRKTFASAVSGSIASMLSMTLMYPLDRVRAVKQLGQQHGGANINEGILEVLSRIVKEEGWMGLYNGLYPMLVALGTSNLVFFYWEAALKAAVIFIHQRRLRGKEVLGGGPSPSDISTFTSLAIATVAGVINVFLTTPLWIAYTRLTTQNRNEQEKLAVAAAILRRNSEVSLADNQSPQNSPKNSPARRAVKSPKTTKKALLGDIATTITASGIEVNKKKRYEGISDCVSRISNEEGISELWSGLGPSLLLVSNPTLQFVAYARMKNTMISYLAGRRVNMDYWNALDDDESLSGGAESKKLVHQSIERSMPDLGDFHYLLLGGLSKLFATLLTYPIQVAQTRLRADAAPKSDGTKKQKKYHGTFHCLMTIYTEEGLTGLYKGMNAKMLQTCLTSAFMFLFYERISSVIFRIMLRRKFEAKR